MTVRRIAVVTAGLSNPSSTRLLADQLAAATDQALRLHEDQVQIDVVELRDLAHELTNAMLTGFPGDDLAAAMETVSRADGLIAVTPIFSASYSGLFKTFFDLLEDDTLAGRPVLVAATAGTARHSLALDFAIRPLFAYLKAVIVPTAVFAATEDFGRAGADAALSERVDRAARELADLIGARPLGSRVDPFDDVTPFEQFLTGSSQPTRK